MMNKWISVADRMPEEGVNVLVCEHGEDVPYIACQWDGRWELDTHLVYGHELEEDICSEKVTHWMPLPRMPSEWEQKVSLIGTSHPNEWRKWRGTTTYYRRLFGDIFSNKATKNYGCTWTIGG